MSTVSLANMALRRLGAERISSLTGASRPPRAVIMAESERFVRRKLLESAAWTFARKRVKLSTVAGTPDFEYAYQFQLPTDCLWVVSEYNDAIYKVEGRLILSNESSLSLIYIRDIEDDSQYTPTFEEAFYLKWAIEASYSITQKEAKVTALRAELEDVLADARSFDSRASSPDEYEIDDFIESRI